MNIKTTKDLDNLLVQSRKAANQMAEFQQETIDRIFRKAALAANNARIPLARAAAAETGRGIMEDKVIKNHFASEYIYNKYATMKTTGIIEVDEAAGIRKIAEPIGIIAGIIPVTNPTSTAIFKALISLKTANAIVFAPHPSAKKCTAEAARIVYEAALSEGAPEGIISWIDEPQIELTNGLMQHKEVNLILATGGPGMVRAAYASGHPAIGVGAGNTPAIIDETAHYKMAVSSILLSKTFDNGMICASEQSVIVTKKVYETVKKEFKARGAYLLSAAETEKLRPVLVKDGKLNATIVGQSPQAIAEMAGIKVPADARVLIGEVEKIGEKEPFSFEKLSPVLALYKAADFEDAVGKAVKLIEFGGFGHTAALYTDPANNDRIEIFEKAVKTGRILLNMPSSQGAIGDIYNFKLEPSLTLGCGSWGGNAVSENVGIKHLLNVKTVAARRENMLWFRVPPKIYFKSGCLELALSDLEGRQRALIVTDKPLYDLGYSELIEKALRPLNIESRVFFDVQPDPTLADIRKGTEVCVSFQPDVIIALGGGSPMDAAKIMWLLYEHPDTDFEGMALRFMDIKKRIFRFPKLGEKATLVAVPTSSGTGSEVTPFAVVTDEKTGIKYPLADYELTPDMAIIDPQLVMSMPPKLTAWSGIDALTHALEAYVSVVANEYTNGLALEAIRLVFKYLPESYKGGDKAVKAKEKMHYAAALAGMAFANGFLGICHSMAHKLGAAFHIPHGLANALLICHVIDYNKTDVPKKQAAFPQYKYPLAMERYARIADYIGLDGKTPEDKVAALVKAIDALKKEVGIPATIAEWGISKKEFTDHLDTLAENAFDDQCTGANPRYPLVEDLKAIYLKAFGG